MVDQKQWALLEARVAALERRPPNDGPGPDPKVLAELTEQVEELRAAVDALQGAIRIIWTRLGELEERPAIYDQLQQQVSNLAATVRGLQQAQGGAATPGY